MNFRDKVVEKLNTPEASHAIGTGAAAAWGTALATGSAAAGVAMGIGGAFLGHEASKTFQANRSRRQVSTKRASEFYDAHGKAIGFEGAINWDKDL